MRRPAPIARVGSRFLQPSVGGHGTEGQSVRLEAWTSAAAHRGQTAARRPRPSVTPGRGDRGKL